MESLKSKLTRLVELIKAINTTNSLGSSMPSIPEIKPPSPPSMKTKLPKNSKIPGVAPSSDKNPKKIAEQIKDGSLSNKTQKIMFKCDGTWTNEDVEKADKMAGMRLYHIHDGPYRITTKPLSLKDITEKYGGAQKLESSGFRLIPHTPSESDSSKESKSK